MAKVCAQVGLILTASWCTVHVQNHIETEARVLNAFLLVLSLLFSTFCSHDCFRMMVFTWNRIMSCGIFMSEHLERNAFSYKSACLIRVVFSLYPN